MSFWKPGDKQEEGNGKDKKGNNQKKSEKIDNKIKDDKNNTKKIEPDKNDIKPTLSKSVMTMKFMKRKSDADLEVAQEAEKRRKLLDSSWTTEKEVQEQYINNGKDALICTKENNDLYTALPGRRSFGGCNIAVERNYEQMMDQRKFNKSTEKVYKNSVSDSEMLERYENLIGLPRGPNQGQRPKTEKIIRKDNVTDKKTVN